MAARGVGGPVIDIATGHGSRWVLTCSARCAGDGRRSQGELVRVDPASGRVLSRVEVANPHALAVGAGAVWVADFWDSTIQRVDPAGRRIAATIELSLPRPVAKEDDAFHPSHIAAGEGAVWVSTARGYVARIDPDRNRVERLLRVEPDAAGAIVAGAGAVWLSQGHLGVLRIDPKGGRPRRIPIKGPGGRRLSATSLALRNGSLRVRGLWVKPAKDRTGHRVYRLTTEAAVAQISRKGVERPTRPRPLRGPAAGRGRAARPR